MSNGEPTVGQARDESSHSHIFSVQIWELRSATSSGAAHLVCREPAPPHSLPRHAGRLSPTLYFEEVGYITVKGNVLSPTSRSQGYQPPFCPASQELNACPMCLAKAKAKLLIYIENLLCTGMTSQAFGVCGCRWLFPCVHR